MHLICCSFLRCSSSETAPKVNCRGDCLAIVIDNAVFLDVFCTKFAFGFRSRVLQMLAITDPVSGNWPSQLKCEPLLFLWFEFNFLLSVILFKLLMSSSAGFTAPEVRDF